MKALAWCLIAMGSVVYSNCSTENHTDLVCGVVNPVEELSWLKDQISVLKKDVYADASVYSATYKGKTVFYTDTCCPVCDLLPPEIKTCTGQSIGRIGLEVLSSDVMNQHLIWETHNGICK